MIPKLPKIPTKTLPVTTPSCDNNKILETSITGDRSITPPTFKTRINFLNFLFKSSTLDWIISVISVGVFVGLTAYDTQKLLKIGVSDNGSDSYKKIAILGALNLYIDFVNIFLNLLRLTGKKK